MRSSAIMTKQRGSDENRARMLEGFVIGLYQEEAKETEGQCPWRVRTNLNCDSEPSDYGAVSPKCGLRGPMTIA